MRRAAAFLAAAVLGGLAGGAFGAHPLVTEDAWTQDPGRHQLELNTDTIRDIDGPDRIAGATLTYGWREGLDLFTSLPLGLSSPRGWGDASVGVKWQFAKRDAFTFALKPELFLPTGSEMKALGTGNPSIGVTLVSSAVLDRWQWHANVAANINRYRREEDRARFRNVIWRVSSAVEYALTEKLQWLLDAGLSHSQEAEVTRLPMHLVTGFIYSPNSDLDLDAGLRLNRRCGDCGTLGTRQFGVGLTWRF
ncbi:transporter [Oxalobacteraceae bacterium OM1]|nr:transporter [Oxalobacteraceae bacterium OM1]